MSFSWKMEAEERLKMLVPMKHAITSIPEEIGAMEARAEAAQKLYDWADPNFRDDEEYTDSRLSFLVKRHELQRNLEQVKADVAEVEAALAKLTEDDRIILDALFIHPATGSTVQFGEALSWGKSTVYRKRNAALERFAMAYYGGTSSSERPCRKSQRSESEA